MRKIFIGRKFNMNRLNFKEGEDRNNFIALYKLISSLNEEII